MRESEWKFILGFHTVNSHRAKMQNLRSQMNFVHYKFTTCELLRINSYGVCEILCVLKQEETFKVILKHF